MTITPWLCPPLPLHPHYSFLMLCKTEELQSEIVDWCKTIFQGQFSFRPRNYVDDPWVLANPWLLLLQIDNDKDAMIFRLRWADRIRIDKIYNKSGKIIYSNDAIWEEKIADIYDGLVTWLTNQNILFESL